MGFSLVPHFVHLGISPGGRVMMRKHFAAFFLKMKKRITHRHFLLQRWSPLYLGNDQSRVIESQEGGDVVDDLVIVGPPNIQHRVPRVRNAPRGSELFRRVCIQRSYSNISLRTLRELF